MTKNIIYYTHNQAENEIEQACRKQLLKSGIPVVSVSLNKSIDFGDKKIVIYGEVSYETMFTQIVLGLIASKADIVFLCESDILYHPTHFNFIPTKNDTFFYNTNYWRIHYPSGHAVWVDSVQSTFACCADRQLTTSYYQRRLEGIKKTGKFNRRYEANRKTGEKAENWLSKYPNLDIKHGKNFCTEVVFKPDGKFITKWGAAQKETDEVDGWGVTKFETLIKNI